MAFIAPPPPGLPLPVPPDVGTALRRAVDGVRRQPVAPAALLVLVVLVVVHARATGTVVVEGSYQLATIGGAVLAFVGARRAEATHRVAWRWIAAGLASSSVADMIWSALYLRDGVVPDPSVADAFWLASYVGMAVGLYLLASAGRRHRTDVDVLLDSATVGVLALLVVWQYSVGAILHDETTSLGLRALWAAYPILDAVLLTMVARLLLGRTRSASGMLLAAGVLSWLVADFLYMGLGDSEAWSAWFDSGWMAGAITIGAAAFIRRHPAAPPRHATEGIGSGRVALASVPIVVPALMELWGHSVGVEPDPLPLLAASAVLATLVFLRMRRFVRSNLAIRAALRSRERHFRALAANSSDAVFVVDAAGGLLSGTTSLDHLLARAGLDTIASASSEPAADGIATWVSPDEPATFHHLLGRAGACDGQVVSAEWPVTAPDGGRRWVLARAVSLVDDSDVGGIVINLNDVTDRKMAEEELTHQALHDALTGLPNRVLLRDRLEHALAGSRRRGRSLAVVYLDLDGFKIVNDSLGHEAGDELLCEVASRLLGVVRAQDTVARLGGDEFAILIEDTVHAEHEAVTVCERVRHALSGPTMVAGRPVLVSASLGVAVADAEATSTSLLRSADIAMYQAKAAGRATWAVYEPVMQTLADQRLQLELDLATAVERAELRLMYQPVVELDTDRIVGLEALLRWEHPTFGLLMPDRFIALAEDTGMIVPIGRWVLETACATLASRHRSSDGADLTMAVNVSARQLASEAFVADVAAALERSALPPASLVLEMTESVLIADVETATRQLHELRALGVRLAIGDFGTGYSALGYLRQFPVDILKIDRSFVSTMTEPERVPALVRGLLDLAATLHLETIAEGIEFELQRDQLRDSNCALGQGYLFAHPLTREDADVLVAGLGSPMDATTV